MGYSKTKIISVKAISRHALGNQRNPFATAFCRHVSCAPDSVAIGQRAMLPATEVAGEVGEMVGGINTLSQPFAVVKK
jgi:hypothetical protein